MCLQCNVLETVAAADTVNTVYELLIEHSASYDTLLYLAYLYM